MASARRMHVDPCNAWNTDETDVADACGPIEEAVFIF